MRRAEMSSCLGALKYRYRGSSRKRRGEILSELESRFCVGRKYLIRLLSSKPCGRPRNPKPRGRKSLYGDAVFQQALRLVWKTTYYMCGRYMKEAMPAWLPSIERKYGAFSPDVRERLLRISASTPNGGKGPLEVRGVDDNGDRWFRCGADTFSITIPNCKR